MNGKEHLDASGLVSRQCYDLWVNTRKTLPPNPEKAFQRSLSAHVTGVDGRVPFTQDEEEAVLRILRRKERWLCFEKSNTRFGQMGFRAKGYHEKENNSHNAYVYATSAAYPSGDGMGGGGGSGGGGLNLNPTTAHGHNDYSPMHGSQNPKRMRVGSVDSVMSPNSVNRFMGMPPPPSSTMSSSYSFSSPNPLLGGGASVGAKESTRLGFLSLAANSLTAAPLPSVAMDNPLAVHSAVLVPPIDNSFMAPQLDGVESPNSFLNMAGNLLNRLKSTGMDCWSTILSLGRMALVSRGWSSPDYDETKAICEQISALYPNESVVGVDLVARSLTERVIYQNQNSIYYIGMIAKEYGGMNHRLIPLSEAWSCLNTVVSAFRRPNEDMQVQMFIRCTDKVDRLAVVNFRIIPNKKVLIVRAHDAFTSGSNVPSTRPHGT